MNDDLREVYERLGKRYETEREEMPVLDEFILEYRWFMCADTRGRVSQCLRVGKEKSPEAYQAVLSKELGKPVNQVIENFFAADDETLREPLVALLNLMSKPFNTAERLSEQGIVREPGLQFPYDVSGKKVGIIGYGLYNQFFLGKCEEFHAFDLRPEKGLLNYRIGREGMKVYPEGIHWHLGKSAVDYAEVLKTLDMVIMTGCTIVNDSYRDILACCEKAEIRGIYGPSNELCPSYLFDLGYNYIFSASVRDKESYLQEQLAPLPMGEDLKFMDLYILRRN